MGSPFESSTLPAPRALPRAAPMLRALAARWHHLPLAIAAVYLVVVGVHLESIVAALSQNADNVAPGQLGRLISGHGTVWLGDSAWYSTLLFARATRSLPFYRTLWEVAPFAASAAAIAALAWSAGRAGGRWAASTTFALAICASAPLLSQLGALDDHVLTWLTDSLLIAGLVWVLGGAEPPARVRWVPLACLLGAFAALNLASDPLLYFGGIAPTLAAASFAHLRGRSAATRAGLAYALGTCALAVAGSRLVLLVMHEQQIGPAPLFHVGLAPLWALSGNLWLWVRSLAVLGGNSFSPAAAVLESLYRAAGVLAVAAVIAAAPLAWLRLRRPNGSETAARDAFVLAWASSGVLLSAAFVGSTAPNGLGTTRYLVGVVFAAAALIPLAARSRRAVALVVAAASVYCVSGVLSIATGQASRAGGPTAAQTAAFERIAVREHVSAGYASYWDAAPITWQSDFRLRIYPAAFCVTGLCRFENSSDSTWYAPHALTRSLLIVDSAEPFMQLVPATLGRPLASVTVGRRYRVLVYGYDIAARIRAAPVSPAGRRSPAASRRT